MKEVNKRITYILLSGLYTFTCLWFFDPNFHTSSFFVLCMKLLLGTFIIYAISKYLIKYI